MIKLILVVAAILFIATSIPVYKTAKNFDFENEPKLAIQKAIRKIWDDIGDKVFYNEIDDLSLDKIQYKKEEDILNINLNDDLSNITGIKLNNEKICVCSK